LQSFSRTTGLFFIVESSIWWKRQFNYISRIQHEYEGFSYGQTVRIVVHFCNELSFSFFFHFTLDRNEQDQFSIVDLLKESEKSKESSNETTKVEVTSTETKVTETEVNNKTVKSSTNPEEEGLIRNEEGFISTAIDMLFVSFQFRTTFQNNHKL
jgi:hypothetical protein